MAQKSGEPPRERWKWVVLGLGVASMLALAVSKDQVTAATEAVFSFFIEGHPIAAVLLVLALTVLVIHLSWSTAAKWWQRHPFHPKNWGLWWTVVGLVLAGLLIVLFLWVAISWILTGNPLFRYPNKGQTADPLDFVKIALLIAGGIGGVVALTVAYRKQRTNEDSHFASQYDAAAAQLGNSAPIVRIAGVYAMTTLADKQFTSVLRKQQCIDALCTYLRLPYAGTHQGTTKNSPRQPQEREVRLTIIKIIREHLIADAVNSWAGHEFDFSGATFDGGSFARAHFTSGKFLFTDARFTGLGVNFALSHFDGDAITFSRASFIAGTHDFRDIHVRGQSVLYDTIQVLGGKILFTTPTEGVHRFNFRQADLKGGDIRFFSRSVAGESTLELDFTNADFGASKILFDNATFTNISLEIHQAHIKSENISFTGATFTNSSLAFVGLELLGTDLDLSSLPFRNTSLLFKNLRVEAGIMSLSDSHFFESPISLAGTTLEKGAIFFFGSTFLSSPIDILVPPIESSAITSNEGIIYIPSKGVGVMPELPELLPSWLRLSE